MINLNTLIWSSSSGFVVHHRSWLRYLADRTRGLMSPDASTATEPDLSLFTIRRLWLSLIDDRPTPVFEIFATAIRLRGIWLVDELANNFLHALGTTNVLLFAHFPLLWITYLVTTYYGGVGIQTQSIDAEVVGGD